jgi:hypothetical protein
VALTDLGDWLNEWLVPGSVWYLKRLAANDTLATHSHQAGPYVPKDLLFEVFPRIHDESRLNPDLEVDAYIDSHADHRRVRVIWYNNKLHGGTRNETRITNWGGASSAVLDPESTGALAIFVFSPPGTGGQRDVHIWVCRHPTEEDLVEERISPVEPGAHLIWHPGAEDVSRLAVIAKGELATCRLSAEQLPPSWGTVFPSGMDIVQKVRELRPLADRDPDVRLLRRRDCEFELFQSVEEAVEGGIITKGFGSIAEFLVHAQRILQRRKARSGRSLELQMREILIEEGFSAGRDFSHGPESDPGKRPDFLFPSEEAYKNAAFPEARLRMLAAKTTCKDRWRQILSEADRITQKHLLTLQEGVSESQYAEMKAAGVRLVIPQPLIESFPESVRPELITVEAFIGDVRHLAIRG